MSVYTIDSLMAALVASVEAEMARIVSDEAEAAAERVRRRAKELAPQLVMQLLKNFDVQRDRQEIVIRFRTIDPADLLASLA